VKESVKESAQRGELGAWSWWNDGNRFVMLIRTRVIAVIDESAHASAQRATSDISISILRYVEVLRPNLAVLLTPSALDLAVRQIEVEYIVLVLPLFLTLYPNF